MASLTEGEQNPQVRTDSLPAAIQALTPMTTGIVPITDDERRGRIAKAQRLMEEQKVDAIFMEGGTSSYGCGLWSRLQVPGLPHRTGHGIGLDGHEWTNVVKGNKTPIQPGMCFSDEPMLAVPGEFGIRLEDDVYVGEDGPRFFTKPSLAIDRPFAD